MNQIDLSGRVAVVTGGASGIGGAIVRHLHASGAEVAVWDLAECHGLPDGVIGLCTDVTSSAALADAQAMAVARFGTIDILVAAAGATGPATPAASYAEADWRRVVDLNLTGTFLACQAVLPLMRAQDYGRIVTIASIAGKEGNQDLAAYSAAKAGVIALTKVLGRELAETGMRVNTVTPGLFETPILQQLTPEAIRWSRDRIPMKRAGRLEEIGAMIAWLASEECSFSTGAVFNISGGRAVY